MHEIGIEACQKVVCFRGQKLGTQGKHRFSVICHPVSSEVENAEGCGLAYC